MRTIALVVLALFLLLPASAFAHCDTLSGPVVSDARLALTKGDVTPVLKWVHKDKEAEIRDAFAKTVKVRAASPEARELADRYFFETLVRIHREGEGAPYTGLKAEPVEAGIDMADKAIESGSADAVVKRVADAAAEGVRHRFQEVVEKKKHAAHNVEAGREYVAAYVEFIHYVERLHQDAERPAGHHGTQATAHQH